MEFSLHNYLNHLRDTNASAEYIDAIQRNAKPLVDNDLPVILTQGHLAHVVGMPYSVLTRIIKRQIDPYRVFSIRKRSGGKRYICVPEPGLLDAQRWIHENILCSRVATRMLTGHSTAYVPGSSHVLNAKKHLGASWILKLDITNFFESISERQVYYVFRSLGYRALVAFCAARICTRVLPRHYDNRKSVKRWRNAKRAKFFNSKILGHLPQGAPTSPMLANIVCSEMDRELNAISVHYNLTYTRYADDMTFSGELNTRDIAMKIAKEVSLIVGRYGFAINSQKTSFAKNGGRKIVTGLSVEGNIIRLPRIYKDAIKQELFFINRFGLENHCLKIGQKNYLSYLMRLVGRIKYASSIEPVFGKRMMNKFTHLFPEYMEIRSLI